MLEMPWHCSLTENAHSPKSQSLQQQLCPVVSNEKDGKSFPAEPLVTIHLGNRKVDFLVDTKATCSVLNTYRGNFSSKTVNTVYVLTHRAREPPIFTTFEIQIRETKAKALILRHARLPCPSVREDLWSKLGAQMSFKVREVLFQLPECKAEEIRALLLMNSYHRQRKYKGSGGCSSASELGQ